MKIMSASFGKRMHLAAVAVVVGGIADCWGNKTELEIGTGSRAVFHPVLVVVVLVEMAECSSSSRCESSVYPTWTWKIKIDEIWLTVVCQFGKQNGTLTALLLWSVFDFMDRWNAFCNLIRRNMLRRYLTCHVFDREVLISWNFEFEWYMGYQVST